MKQNLLTISIDSDKLKKFPEKFNFLNFFHILVPKHSNFPRLL